jgi:hypothetical protein
MVCFWMNGRYQRRKALVRRRTGDAQSQPLHRASAGRFSYDLESMDGPSIGARGGRDPADRVPREW